MALLERLEIVIEADAREAAREFDRIGREAERSLGGLEDTAGDVGENVSERLTAAAREAAAGLSRAVDGERGDAEQAGTRLGQAVAEGVEAGVDRVDVGDKLSGDVRAAGRDADGVARNVGEGIGDNLSAGVDAGAGRLGEGLTQRVRAGLGGLPQVGRQVGSETGDGISGGLLDGLGGVPTDIGGIMDDALGSLPAGVAGPAAAAGAVVGAAVVSGFADAIETAALGDLIAARVGAGADKSAEFGRAAANVYRQAWGESTAEVADAVDAVYSTLAESRESEAALQDLTTRAQSFADVFDTDVALAVSNAGILIETGLARNAVEAFDLMTEAAQNVPAAMRDELGDATQEYSTFFASLGFDGEEAFGLLASAADMGTYAVDKTGDAIKELSIRATDLNDNAAMTALEDLGLDAQETANNLLAGGEAARVATQQIVDALNSVRDPAEQAALATALLGTPIEDLNKSQIPEFIANLSDASQAQLNSAGASDKLADSINNLDSAFTVVKRSFLGVFEDLANEGLQPLAEFIEDQDKSVGDAAVALGKTAGREFGESFILGLPGQLIPQDWWDRYGPIAVFKDAWHGNWWGKPEEDVGKQVGRSTGAAFAQGAREGVEAAPPILDLDAITGGDYSVDIDTSGAVSALERVNDEIALTDDLFDLAADRATNYLSAVENSTGLDDLLSSTLDLNDALGAIGDAFVNLRGVNIDDIISGDLIVGGDVADGLRDIMAAGEAAQQTIAQVLEFEGADAAVARADEVRGQIVGMAEAAGLTDTQVNTLLTTMGLSDWQIDAAVTLSGVEEAIAKLQLLLAFTENEFPKEIEAQVTAAIADDRFGDAANLISIWIQDQQDGLITNPLLIELGVGNFAEASAMLQDWYSDPGIPDELVVQGAVAFNEGRLDDAANLLNIWKQDAADGFIDNPLLVAMGVGGVVEAGQEVDRFRESEEAKPPAEIPIGAESTQAERDVEAWKQRELAGPPPELPVGADTLPARSEAARLFFDIQRLNPTLTVNIAANFAKNAGIIPFLANGLIPTGPPDGELASGGPVVPGGTYLVGEEGPELVVPKSAGTVIPADETASILGATSSPAPTPVTPQVSLDTDRLAAAVEQLVAAQQNTRSVAGDTYIGPVIAPTPERAASAVARELRQAS